MTYIIVGRSYFLLTLQSYNSIRHDPIFRYKKLQQKTQYFYKIVINH